MNIEGSLLSHLVELRTRLIRTLGGLLIGFIPCAFYARELYTMLAQPLLEKLPQGGQMIATDVATPFFVPMKVAMMLAFVITLPHTLYQAWAFIAPGLYSHEKRLALPLVIAGSLLFFLGMSFAYFAALPLVFEFITYFAPEGVAVMTDINKYLSFVLSMFMAFGITFEVPVVVMVLVKTGFITIEKLKEIRPYVIVGSFVIAAIITPPDVISQFMLAVPLCLLYEVGIIIATLTIKESPRANKNTVSDQSENDKP
ncbi:MAG: twin-arginine translocase subunit TatC [Burkholderiales bacterium]|uniref:twin-arginine translocase subunit TatC n=1 Tax=Nitrosomonas sp. TaxID=42353 RepID=UPI001D20363F|nr:twin-arginine translocase subunit TatC [Nitrosomonas sp.]MCB1949688.1 twin-arginine translocase subunit TatC [Nitrosomonas sp.]MCP5242166.1 twin-arginine translocase subunit TatC [Burkholderiales bacterium]